MGKKYDWDDEWILQNANKFHGWHDMVVEYNKVHGTNFTNHQLGGHAGGGASWRLNIKTERNTKYTEEQIEWLRDHYPFMTRKECVELFNKTFETHRTTNGISALCKKNGIFQTQETMLKARQIGLSIGQKQVDVGYTRVDSVGNVKVKTENGWMPQSRYEYIKNVGKLNRNEVLIHLDGNNSNNSPTNLMPLKKSLIPQMVANEFYSENAEITKTGVMWCQLYELVK